MPPNARKNVVQLDVDGTEGQEACHKHLARALPVPWDRWYLPRYLVCSARGGEIFASRQIPPNDAADDCQRQRHESPYADDDEDGSKWQRRLRIVSNRDGVEEKNMRNVGAGKSVPLRTKFHAH